MNKRYPLTPTEKEIKKKIFDVWLRITPDGMFRTYQPEGFEVDGIKADQDPDKVEIRVALRPIELVADSEPMDQAAESGTFLKIKMRDGRTVERFISGRQLENGRLWETLRGLGCRILPSQLARHTIRDYLLTYESPKVIRTYGKSGWTKGPKGEPAFVLGSEVIGDTDGRFESIENLPTPCESKGSIDSWIENIAAPANKSPIWGFAVCAAFAAPLMEALNYGGGGGWHFYGASSTGKSLALEIASSVFGPPKYKQTWNTTAGGVEVMAEAFNGLLLCLDELGEATASTVRKTIYSLSDGIGKASMTQDRQSRRRRTWNLLSLSVGEVSIEDKVAERNGTLRAGQALRIADIYAAHPDLKRDLPIEARQLKQSITKHYGTAGREFVIKLLEEMAEENNLRNQFDAIYQSMTANIEDARRARAAERFALVRLAGECAKDYGLLPQWFSVADHVNAVWATWLSDTAARTCSEDQQAARALIDFIDAETGQSISVCASDNEIKRESNGKRSGWLRLGSGSTQPMLFMLRKSLDDAIGAYNLRTFCAAMSDQQILKHNKNSYTQKTPKFWHLVIDEINQANYPRTYQFDLSKLRQFCGDVTDENETSETQTPKGEDYGRPERDGTTPAFNAATRH